LAVETIQIEVRDDSVREKRSERIVMCPRCFCRGKRRGFHIEDDDVKRERVYRPPLGRGALVKVVRVDEDDVMCFDERSDVSNFYEADEREKNGAKNVIDAMKGVARYSSAKRGRQL
jgi:hypothetical protein